MRAARTTPIIPRRTLFAPAARTDCQLSPDGKWLSWIAPSEGVPNIWLAPIDDVDAARPVTDDRKVGITQYGWMPSARHIFFVHDEGSARDWHIFALDIASGASRDLTPLPGVFAEFIDVSPNWPNLIAAGLNDRDPAWHDLYTIDVTTGERELVFENRGEFTGFALDRQLRPRLASRVGEDGCDHVVYRVDRGAPEIFRAIAAEDELTEHSVGFTRDGNTLYRVSAAGRDKAALMAIDWSTGEQQVIAEHSAADIDGSFSVVHPQTYAVEAVAAEYLEQEWFPLNTAIAADLAHLRAALAGSIRNIGRTADDSRWLLLASAANLAPTYYLYARATRTLTEVFSQRPALSSYSLAPARSRVIRSRDGLDLSSYLTLPPETDPCLDGPLPLVLLVHGGPWSRDFARFNPTVQWLADRGYAVLRLNFRGSTGFGKAFLNAGNGEWGAKMQDDLVEAVKWAIAEGVADRSRIAIMGACYGGYATLAGLAGTPDLFCCGIDIAGPSDLTTLVNAIPAYWERFVEMHAGRIGDPRTDAGRKLLALRSPLAKAGNIRKPLLIAQGGRDPRAKRGEAEQMVGALRDKGLPVTYVLFPDEGHGLVDRKSVV